MFCRACWDVYNADVTEEMKIKERRALLAEGFCNNESCACCRPSFEAVTVAAKWPKDPKDARTVSKQFAERGKGTRGDNERARKGRSVRRKYATACALGNSMHAEIVRRVSSLARR
jgi:hypothetical protein